MITRLLHLLGHQCNPNTWRNVNETEWKCWCGERWVRAHVCWSDWLEWIRTSQ